ncbi:unnamed protein product [Rotaria sp. Silwood2]|nr:unnamed protein product [Rotaria sp. Silwood2]
MSIIISIENLSNELLYKIFDYLDVNELFEAFSNLNYRFEQLLNSPLLLFKMKFHLTSYLLYTNFYEQMKLINKYQIYSLYVYLPLRNNLFFSSLCINSSFTNLKFLTLNEVQPDVLLVVLSTLSNIPRLSSLTINNFNILKYSTDIYRIVFNLPLLKYFKFSTSNSDLLISLPTRTDEQYSSIKYLVIDHHCTLDEIGLLTSYTPQLDRLYVNKVAKNLHNFSGINLYHLNSIYLNIYNITFNELEIFLIKIYSNLKTLSMKCSNDTMFLNTHRWELLIMNYYPELEKFYLKYCDRISNDGFYKEKIDLSSSFWIKKKWIFGIEFSFGNIKMKYNNHHPNSLCLNIPTTDDKILENIKETIKYENLPPPFIIKRILDNVYLKWK